VSTQVTPRMLKFAQLYAATGHSAKSYLAAGYADRGTGPKNNRQAYQVLHRPAMQRLVELERGKLAKQLDLRMVRVLAELTACAFSDIADYIGEIDDEVLSVHDIPRMARAAIKKLKRVKRIDKNGDEVITTELELHDKLRPLERVMEIVGLGSAIDPATGEKSEALTEIRITMPGGRVLRNASAKQSAIGKPEL